MAVMKSKDGNDFVIDCNCGCNDGIRFKFYQDEYDEDDICLIMSNIGCEFYSRQRTILSKMKEKFKRIWFIIRDKEYQYFDITITKKDFEEFRQAIDKLKFE